MTRAPSLAFTLTAEQRQAVTSTALRQLVVAAAGSGKTATMVAKVLYAVQTRHIPPEQILVLAFNTRAANELGVRIAKALQATNPKGTTAPDQGVVTSTLHALGLSVVRQASSAPLQVVTEKDLLVTVVQDLVEKNDEFVDQWLVFRRFYAVPLALPEDMTRRARWRRFLKQQGRQYAGGAGFMSIAGVLLPTQFEQAVADWLLLHGIHFRFVPWQYHSHALSRWWVARFGVLSGKQGFLLARGQWILCVRGASTFVGARRTPGASPPIILSLTAFYDGSWLTCLRTSLARQSYDLSRAAQRLPELLSRFGQPMVAAQWQLLQQVVHAPVKSTAYAAFFDMHKPMFLRLSAAYHATLQAQGRIDFEAMLTRAASCLQQRQVVHRYAMVLVDEFQDTSRAGLTLLQALLQQRPQTEFFAVGDDWQSIYGFAGALPEVMQRFSDYFGAASIGRLTATFRFNQTIADAASHFIQQNPEQLPKQVRAFGSPYPQALQVVYYAHANAMASLCHACLQQIADATQASTPSDQVITVLILGRYQHMQPGQLRDWQQAFPRLQIGFLTIHAAKGLEADYVIVLGLGRGRYGLPSGVAADPWLQALHQRGSPYPYAEERRVFYVALTRAKRQVVCLVDKTRPSPFIADLPASCVTYKR